MRSAVATAADAVAFEPTEAGLERILGLIADRDGSDAAGATREERESAFARYRMLAGSGPRPGRGWRHDYDALHVPEVRWTTGTIVIPTSPFDALAALTSRDAEPDGDVPSLAVENAAGLLHLGARALRQAVSQNLPDGVIVAPFDEAMRDQVETVTGSPAGHDDPTFGWHDSLRAAVTTDRFAALAEAFRNCGAFVYVPAGMVIEKPIQLVFATPEGNDEAVFPRIVVRLGAGARATVIERHVGSADAFLCGTVLVDADEGSTLDYVAVQQTGENARVFMYRNAECSRNANVRFHVAELGGTLVRSVVEMRLGSEGSRGETSALFFNTGFQHADLSTTTTHAVPNTTSDTVVRSAATDRGQGRFVGNIAILARAHGSDATLRDDALLLSKHAHIDSVPALEIAANDVKAFHGATVGSLDEDALFYAGSRGIARPDAIRMVALAFFEPVIARLPSEALRDEVRTALDHKIDAATEIDG